MANAAIPWETKQLTRSPLFVGGSAVETKEWSPVIAPARPDELAGYAGRP